MGLKQSILDNLKNIHGWKTDRKIVVLNADDYGNVRLDSRDARERMDKAGLNVHTRFDAYDTLETSDDLSALFDVLRSVTDRNGRHAVFTPYTLPCNIDYEAMAKNGYREYLYEPLPETFKKLEQQQPNAYSGAWELWQEGMAKGLMKPQFHGREHLNLKSFEEKLARQDEELLTALKNRSFTSISKSGYTSIGTTAAFSFWDPSELERLKEVLETGLAAFREVFGFSSDTFTPPAQSFHDSLKPVARENGVKAIDRPFMERHHLGFGKYKRKLNRTRFHKKDGMAVLVRNVIFEPAMKSGRKPVEHALNQVRAAFRWRRPAIISSHRVNFCGHIDEKNREKGLNALKELLRQITEQWPDAEFMSADELAALIRKD